MEKSFKESTEEIIAEFIEELLEEQKKLEKINYEIKKHTIIERLNINKIVLKTLDETNVIDETKTRLRKLKTKIMKKWFLEEIDEQETLERLERKMGTEKLENVYKIK